MHAKKRQNRMTAYVTELETQLHDRFLPAGPTSNSNTGDLFIAHDSDSDDELVEALASDDGEAVGGE